MAQGRSTKIISMIKWTRTSRLSRKDSLSLPCPWSHQQRSHSPRQGRIPSKRNILAAYKFQTEPADAVWTSKSGYQAKREQLTTSERLLALEPMPESGFDCLTCAIFARQRVVDTTKEWLRCGKYLALRVVVKGAIPLVQVNLLLRQVPTCTRVCVCV